MKKLLISIILTLSFNSFAQEKVELSNEKPTFECNSLKHNPDKNTIELIGNVCFKTNIIEFENADKIVWNRETNEIVVTGLKEFTIDGKIQFSKNREKKILRYKIGERIAYVE